MFCDIHNNVRYIALKYVRYVVILYISYVGFAYMYIVCIYKAMLCLCWIHKNVEYVNLQYNTWINCYIQSFVYIYTVMCIRTVVYLKYICTICYVYDEYINFSYTN